MRETLILVPGLGADERLCVPQIAALRERADQEHLRHDTIPAVAAAILAQAPRRFALAGTSMGGYVALEQPAAMSAAMADWLAW